MGKNTAMTVRLSPEISDKLDALARDTKRSKAYIASEAIADYVVRNACQVARIRHALVDARSGAPGITNEEIERWMGSWDSDNELAPPEPKL